MDQERMDLSALDPTADRLAYERLVRRIMAAAAPELARRATTGHPLAMLAGWARPMLTAAAIVAVFAIGALAATDRATADRPATLSNALGLPAPAADWLTEEREPTEYDLVLALERRR